MNVEQELSKVTSVTKKEGERHQDFLRRLLRASTDVNDVTWASLSPAAADWINAAAAPYDAKRPLPPLPSGEAKSSANTGKPREQQPVTQRNAKTPPPRSQPPKSGAKPPQQRPTNKLPPKKAAPAKPMPKKAPAKSHPGGIVGVVRVRRLFIEGLRRGHEPSLEELVNKMENMGYDIGRFAIGTTRTDFRTSLRVLQELGHLKGIKMSVMAPARGSGK